MPSIDAADAHDEVHDNDAPMPVALYQWQRCSNPKPMRTRAEFGTTRGGDGSKTCLVCAEAKATLIRADRARKLEVGEGTCKEKGES